MNHPSLNGTRPTDSQPLCAAATLTGCQQRCCCSDDLSPIHTVPLEASVGSVTRHVNELLATLLNPAGRPLQKQSVSHFKGLHNVPPRTSLWTSSSRSCAHISEIVPTSWCGRSNNLLVGTKSRTLKRGNKGLVWFFTYLIEKGEHCQPVWLISGLREALVLVRIVVDDVELEDEVEMRSRLGAKKLFGDLLLKWRTPRWATGHSRMQTHTTITN